MSGRSRETPVVWAPLIVDRSSGASSSDVGPASIKLDLESEELTTLLNHYLTEMSLIALAHGATIDKYIGDAILAFFGDPETRGVKEGAIACVNMAIAMQTRMRELQVEGRDRGLQKPFQLREKENSSCEPWF